MDDIFPVHSTSRQMNQMNVKTVNAVAKKAAFIIIIQKFGVKT